MSGVVQRDEKRRGVSTEPCRIMALVFAHRLVLSFSHTESHLTLNLMGMGPIPPSLNAHHPQQGAPEAVSPLLSILDAPRKRQPRDPWRPCRTE